ncbi:MerR family transcriptional regulator [Pelotalea chapellei]|uniref:MerR family transcriptional regulator n=1 Tax=Pelotalea chapellei TaxID=44671 RepID=A0ABS5UCE6_9BACT|nr:MerR family transcriptional regulator [Pelotalea chapellei]MBT1073342.1 MerR family transcriptional regulator [Pelotalea chapellei]
MSLTKTWYAIDEIVEKFGLERWMIAQWIEDGTVRSEMADAGVQIINIDDVELKVQEMTKI